MIGGLVHHDPVERINYHNAKCKKCRTTTVLPAKEFAVSWQKEQPRGA